MTTRPRRPTGSPYSEEEIRRSIELLFFAYRDFTADPDRILEPLGMGRAHHRVLHFVGRNPGITVGALLVILKITKQSLNRVLGQLLREGYIVSKPGPTDRRERRLALTAAGSSLERRLFDSQRGRVEAALSAGGTGGAEGFREVLLALVNASDRARLAPPDWLGTPLSGRRRVR
jgi:DNA-binding MarR family transcriptional regulator